MGFYYAIKYTHSEFKNLFGEFNLQCYSDVLPHLPNILLSINHSIKVEEKIEWNLKKINIDQSFTTIHVFFCMKRGAK